MAHCGHRHSLALYSYVLNHWWRRILGIGIVLLLMVITLRWLPSAVPQYTPFQLPDQILWFAGSVAIFTICIAIFLMAIRRAAYVQPCDAYLRLVTPFLRMNISYRRFIRASSVEMRQLFQLENLKGQKRNYFLPLARQTAIVLELKGWPMPRRVLSLFLSPFFFPDGAARLALLVPDWMKFSIELESYRSIWHDSTYHSTVRPQSELLASLSRE
jgi:hypothetical protein